MSWLLLGPALVAFMLPGWQIARRLALPATAVAAFLISACGWFALVLFAQIVGLPLTRPILVGAWLAAGLGACLWLWRNSDAAPVRPWPALPERVDWPWMMPVAIAFTSVVARSLLDPLNGWDTTFRWDYLARAVISHAHLDFYPPTTAADYEIYAWCDGIPPLASLLNLWIYLSCGSTTPALLAGRLIGEALLASTAIFHLARSLHGPRAGWPALAVLAACPLFLWSVAMGQETGLTTIALIAMAYYISEYIRDGNLRAAFCAGLAAAVAAISRDYMIAFVALGAGLIAPRAEERYRSLALFAVTPLLVAAPWYVRNWALTGNPIYPHTLGHLFAGNPVMAELLSNIYTQWAFSANTSFLSPLASVVFCLCASLSTGIFGIRPRQYGHWPALLCLGLITGLWAWSAQLTAGGWNYSLRVLAPSAALLAGFAGYLHLCRSKLRIIIIGALLLLTLDASHRSWFLPVTPKAAAWPYDWQRWREHRSYLYHFETSNLWPTLVQRTHGEVILVDATMSHRLVTDAGGRATMLFSPAAMACFDPTLDFHQAVAALRKEQIRLVLLSVDDPISQSTIQGHSFLRSLVAQPNVIRVAGMSLYDLQAISPATSP